MLSDRCLSVCLSVLSCMSCLSYLSETFVHCGQMVGRIKMKLGMQVGLGPGHIVLLNGDPAPPPSKGYVQPPIFGPYLLRPNGCMDQGVTWYGDRPRPRRLVLDGDPAPLPQKGAKPPPQFSVHFYCGQTAGWIKMPLGMEVGLGLRDIVFDVDPATSRKKGTPTPPNFWPMSIVAKWLDG